LRKEKLNFGGEQSGHLIFLRHSTTGDGLLAALQVLAIFKEKGKALSELARGIDIFPQVLLNVKVRERKELGSLSGLSRLQGKIQKELGEKGRLLLRFSGTEPVLRIMVEGEDASSIQTFAQELKTEAEKALGKG
jgi:phosphoglucosamine mutase